jgi:HEAT repeat protein
MVKSDSQPPEQDALAASVSKLQAAPSAMGTVYDACSHAFVMVRETGVEELAEAMRDEKKTSKQKAEALNELLHQMQHSKERYIRDRAAKALGEIAAFDDKVCNVVMQLLNEQDANVKEAAIMALRSRLQTDRVMEAIVNVQKGVTGPYQTEVQLIELMHQLVDDENGRVRFAAIDALGTLVNRFHTESITKVASRMTDHEAWIRRHAAELLCQTLSTAEERKRSQTASLLAFFFAEAWSELVASTIRCYQVGKECEDGEDVHMRKIAIRGMTAAAKTSFFEERDTGSSGCDAPQV